MSRLEAKAFLAGLLVLLVGCSSPAAKTEDDAQTHNPIVGPFVGDDLYANIPSDKITIQDDDVGFSGDKDPDYEKVARWATERRHVITWCLNEFVQEMNEYGQPEPRYKRVWPDDPSRLQTRFDQAIAISTKVVDKIPDNTRERARLAWCLFDKGSAFFWMIDACMNRIGVLKVKMGGDEKNPQFPDQVAEIERLRDTAEKYKKDMFIYHAAALRNFNAYLAAMPMDRKVLDFIWKIHFQMGNFREAVRVLNQVLDEDLVQPDKRDAYVRIRKDINDYLVEREINANAPKPLSPEALKRSGERPN